MHPLAFLGLILQAYSLVVLVSVVGSWVGSRHPIFEFADRITEPALAPIRRVIPPAAGFDLSPMVLLILLNLLGRILAH